MAKKKAEEKINIDSILFKCRDILRAARNSGSFFEKRDMMLTLVFLRFIGEKFEDGVAKLREDLIAQGLDPDDEEIFAAFFDDATFTDGTYNLPIEARWSTIINTPAPQLNVALDTALHSIATSSKQLRGCFVEGTFTTRNLAANDIKKIVDEVNKISHKAFGEEKDLTGGKISRQTVMNCVRESTAEITESTEKRAVSELHIDADEAHVTLIGGKKSIVPLVSVYEGIETIGKRKSCKNVFHISEYGKNNDDFWEQVSDEIEKRYILDEAKIYLHADGGG